MTKHQLAQAIADDMNKSAEPGREVGHYTKKDVFAFFESLERVIVKELKLAVKAVNKGEKPAAVVLPGLGRFGIQARKARMGRNPQTGETIKIKASKKLKITAPKPLRDALKVK